MRTLLIVLMVASGLLFILSVLLMSPKWGLGFGLWWASGSNEYWSKKSVENTLKKVAIVTSIIFVCTVIFLPFVK